MIESALELIESVADSRVLFVGEGIRDIYEYVSPLGRPLKDLILSVKAERREVFEGGIHATAAHAAAFCGIADVWSDRTVTKLRYVEQAYFRKLFQCYMGMETNSSPMPNDISEYDAVCVVDYGHGMMDQEYALKVEDEAAYLAVNVQANSGNYGFNLATKYDHCDYLVLDELEARLATQNQFGDIESSLKELAHLAPKIIVTLGKNGAIGWSEDGGIRKCYSFTPQVTDTIGAGDAFFGVTAPMSRHGSIEDLMLIGNVAGGLKAQIVGHRHAITKQALIEKLKLCA